MTHDASQELLRSLSRQLQELGDDAHREKGRLELRRADLFFGAHQVEQQLGALRQSWAHAPRPEAFFSLKLRLEQLGAAGELRALLLDGVRRATSPALRACCLLRVADSLHEGTDDVPELEATLEAPETLGFVRWQPQTARGLVETLLRAGRAAAAITVLRTLLEEVRDERSFDDALTLARLEHDRGADEAAYAGYRMALRLRPAAIEALEPARQHLLASGSHEALAELLAQSAAAATPNERAATLWRDLARLAERRLADRARAIQAWRHAWALEPTGEEVAQLKRLYATEEQWGRYLGLLKRAALRCDDPADKVEIYREMATCQLEVLEDERGALDSYGLLLQLAPDDRDALAATVEILQRQIRAGAEEPSLHDYLRLARAMRRFVDNCDLPAQRDAMLRQLIAVEREADDNSELISHLQQLDPRDEQNERFVTNLWQQALAGGAGQLSGLLGEVGLVLLGLRCGEQSESRRLAAGLELAREALDIKREQVAAVLLRHLALVAPTDDEVADLLSRCDGAGVDEKESRQQALAQQALAVQARDPERATRLFIDAAKLAAHRGADSDETLRMLHKARRACPQDARHAIRLLEVAYEELALPHELATFLGQQLRWRPGVREEARLRGKLARLYRQELDRPQEALEQLEALLELSPDDPVALRDLIAVHRESSHYGQVVNWLAIYLEQCSGAERVAALEELGAVYADKLADERMAFHYYGQLLLLRPDHELALAFVRGRGSRGNEARRRVASLLAQAAESSEEDKRRDALLEEAATLAEQDLGDHDFAIAQWRRIASLRPSYRKARQELKRLLGAAGRWGELETILLSECARVEDAPEKATLYLELARLSRTQLGDLESAGNHLRAAHQLAPRNADVLTEMAIVYEALEQWRRLATVLERHAELEGDERKRTQLLHRAAELLVKRLGQREEALAVCRRIREIVPGDSRSTALMSEIYASRSQWKNLAALLREQLTHESIPAKLVPLRLQLGKLLRQRLGEPDRAAEQFEAVLELAPDLGEPLVLLREVYSETGHWDRLAVAIERRAAATSVAPSVRADAFFEVGQIKQDKLADEAGARRAYEQALQLVADHRSSMAALRKLAADKGDWREVLSLARHELDVLTHAPDKARLLVEIAEIMETQLQRPGAATEALREALALDEHNDAARARLGLMAFVERRWEDAVRLLGKLVDGAADVESLHEHLFRLGRAHEELGAQDEAFSCYVKSFSREPLYLPTLNRLLDLCYARRQWENAERIAEAIISSYGDEKSPRELADVFVVLGLCQLHQAQQRAALRRLQAIALPRGAQPVASDEAWEDVAKSWAATAAEPKLLRDVEFKVITRVIKAMEHALARAPDHPGALQILAALTLIHGDWDRSVRYLERAAQSSELSAAHRAALDTAAGDVAWSRLLSRKRGEACYRRALALVPGSTLVKRKLSAIGGSTIGPAPTPASDELALVDAALEAHPTQELLHPQRKR